MSGLNDAFSGMHFYYLIFLFKGFVFLESLFYGWATPMYTKTVRSPRIYPTPTTHTDANLKSPRDDFLPQKRDVVISSSENKESKKEYVEKEDLKVTVSSTI